MDVMIITAKPTEINDKIPFDVISQIGQVFTRNGP